MSDLGQKFKHELREMIPAALFFIVTFNLIALTQFLMLEAHGIRVSSFLTATLLALLVSKVILIADHLPLIDRFPNKALIYNIAWKTGIYFAASCVLRYAEHVIRFWRKSGNFAEANEHLVGEVVWPRFWGIQLWMLILLLVYCSVRELTGAIGCQKVMQLVFRGPISSREQHEG